MKINLHKIDGSEIRVNKIDIISGKITPKMGVNVGYYDDTELKERMSKLEKDIEDIESRDDAFSWRLSRLEGNYVTRDEFDQLEGRVTHLEVIPVGLTNKDIDFILNS